MLLKIKNYFFDSELAQIAICVFNDEELEHYKNNLHDFPHKKYYRSLKVTNKTMFLKVDEKDVYFKKGNYLETFYKVFFEGKIYWINKGYF